MTTEPGPKKYYGVFDSQGRSQGYYPDDIYPPQPNGDRNASIPATAVEITEAQWKELLSNPQARYDTSSGAIVYAKPHIGTSTYDWGATFVEVIGSY